MNIYVSEDLQYIKKELINRGYNIVGSNNRCDIIICNVKNGGLDNISFQNNVKTEGTLIIDSGHKTVDDIEYIMNNRTYSAIL